MNRASMKTTALLLTGFCLGLIAANLPHATAAAAPPVPLEQRRFNVSIDEIKQNFVFAEEFSGRYAKTVKLSDGSTRDIELLPTVHDGMQLVELRDTGGHTYMGLNGTTTNGTLMVQVRDVDATHAELAAQGWKRDNK